MELPWPCWFFLTFLSVPSASLYSLILFLPLSRNLSLPPSLSSSFFPSLLSSFCLFGEILSIEERFDLNTLLVSIRNTFPLVVAPLFNSRKQCAFYWCPMTMSFLLRTMLKMLKYRINLLELLQSWWCSEQTGRRQKYKMHLLWYFLGW